MKLLVTGGLGFIGQHLVKKLKKITSSITGVEIIVIDNKPLEISDMVNGVIYRTLDIRNYEDILSSFEGVECVFHLAAEARIQASIDNPIHATNTNILGTTNVLEACRVHGVEKIINSSTSAIYGLTDQFPTKETTASDCLNPYAATKLAAEEMVKCYSKVYGIAAYNLRYFNVFGENSPVVGPYSLVVGLFLDQLSRDESLTVVGEGSSLRDFVYVGDVVNANIRAMFRNPKMESQEARGEVLNIGSGTNIKIIDIAKFLSRDITFVPPRIGEAEKTLSDISKTKEILDWTPKTFLLDWLSNLDLPV